MGKAGTDKFIASAQALSKLVGIVALSYEQAPGAAMYRANTMADLRRALPEVTELMHRQIFIGMTRTYEKQYSALLKDVMAGLIKQAWDIDIHARR